MAQFYQVVDQSLEKSTLEEIQRQLYPNLLETSNVQYLIQQDENQSQYQTHEVLVTREQVIVNQSQQIIINQGDVSYAPQLVVTERKPSDFSENESQQHNIYYALPNTENNKTPQRIIQPLILNHQMQNSTGHQVTVTPRKAVYQQMQPHISQQHTQIHLLNQTPQQVITQHEVPVAVVQTQGSQTQMNYIMQNNDVKVEYEEPEEQKIITLQDGTVMGIAEFRRLHQQPVASQKKNQPERNFTQNHQNIVAPQQQVEQSQVNYQTPNNKRFPQKRGSVNNRNRVENRGGRTLSQPQQQVQQQQQVTQQHQQVSQLQTLHQKQQIQQQQVQQQLRQQHALQQQQMMQQQRLQQQPTLIYTPKATNVVAAPQPLPPYAHSTQIQQIIDSAPDDEFSGSIRMLVSLEDGEQRLITFTLPKESCTIQEILEQVGVAFSLDTHIECTTTNHPKINYFVRVGFQPQQYTNDANSSKSQGNTIISTPVDNKPEDGGFKSTIDNTPVAVPTTSQPEMPRSPSPPQREPTPEPPKEEPRYIPGRLAVCNHCGYNSEDFNRCQRCKTKLPDAPKSILVHSPLPTAAPKNTVVENHLKIEKKQSPVRNGGVGPRPKPKPRSRGKQGDMEPVVVTLSSDDENSEADLPSIKQSTELLRRFSSDASVTLSAIRKEPSIPEIQRIHLNSDSQINSMKGDGKELPMEMHSTSIQCRTIRIGSYKIISKEPVIINSVHMKISVPSLVNEEKYEMITIPRSELVKVLVSFPKTVPVLFFYTTATQAASIRTQLKMEEGSNSYFDPLSRDEQFKRITLLPESISEQSKDIIKIIFSKPVSMLDELSPKEANEILMRTYAKDNLKNTSVASNLTELQQLLIYPPGRGGIAINTEDYLCLGQDQFLNDVIIDFYLKYLFNSLPRETQEKVHIFSSFFYKRLTTKPLKTSRKSHPTEWDTSLSAAQKRHARIKNWTKNVNLFEKDVVVIPINERSHWFLAFICFPGIDGCYSMKDDTKVTIVPRERRKKNVSITIGNTTITTVKAEAEEKEASFEEDGDISDRDEAEGDESELESESESLQDEESSPTKSIAESVVSTESVAPTLTPSTPSRQSSKEPRTPIKQPCILIMDSLASAGRSRVVATLREYLTCEYAAKMGGTKIFNKDVIKGCSPKVPQQTNFTDCGLYLLQYVEQFFKDPIKDYHIPIKQLTNWFEEIVVTSKREEISILIRELMEKYNKDSSLLPEIQFPTLNGKLIEKQNESWEDSFRDDEDGEEMEGNADTDDAEKDDHHFSDLSPRVKFLLERSAGSCVEKGETPELMDESIPPRQILTPASTSSFKTSFTSAVLSDKVCKTACNELTPDTSEKKKQETMLYLKSKRINKKRIITIKTSETSGISKKIKKT